MRKSLKDISWQISEEEYRTDSALSYSKLSQFFKNGPKALISNEKADTPSLRFGSLVDCILTAPEEFKDRFYVADIDKFSDSIRLIVELLHQGCPEAETIEDCVDQYMIDTLNTVGYQSNWKDDTRIKKVNELGHDYFTVLKYSTGKIVISPQEFDEARQCVSTLKGHQFTHKVFDCSEDEEIFYQLKFKTKIDDIPFRFMMDICKVNHKEKWILPIDLKTTGKSSEEFEKSFLDWGYWIQGQSYTAGLEEIMLKDAYFKDFKLKPFQFLVINKSELNPLIWEMNFDLVYDYIINKYDTNWRYLLMDANWHLQNGKFNYSRRSYENNGINQIKLKL